MVHEKNSCHQYKTLAKYQFNGQGFGASVC